MSLSALFSQMSKSRVLVVGDFMLDTYTLGTVKRVSPEAPVMVVNAKKINKLPGGAGNVALNLISLGAKVSVLGRLGEDQAKEDLLHSLKKEHIDTKYLYIQKGYQTPIKNRVMADSHQIVRIDFEEKEALSKALEDEVIQQLPVILKGIKTIAISDYAKGFLSDRLLHALMKEASSLHIPVIVDPKGKDFTKYKGAFLIKPNLSEAYLASGYEEGANFDLVVQSLYHKTQIPHIMVTKSSSGITLFSDQTCKEYPVKVREVTDVTGAGDTVLAVLTYAISNKISLHQATILCNLAAGKVIEHLGCSRISIRALAELILDQHLDNKVFSEKFLEILQFILDHQEFILIKLDVEKSLTPFLFRHLKKLKEEHSECKLVIYFDKEVQEEELIELLASLNEVDFIIKKLSNLQKFCQKHAPKKIYELIEDHFETKSSLQTLFAC